MPSSNTFRLVANEDSQGGEAKSITADEKEPPVKQRYIAEGADRQQSRFQVGFLETLVTEVA